MKLIDQREGGRKKKKKKENKNSKKERETPDRQLDSFFLFLLAF